MLCSAYYGGDCHVVGVNTLTYHRCRAEITARKYFTIDQCSDGQVMNRPIQTAEAGYSQQYNPNTNPPMCNWFNCTRSIDQPFTLCHGRHSCRIPQAILYYGEGESLCPLHKHANFINMKFTCVTGMFSVLF